ncbi:MAG: hypothetical protein J6C30_08700 [Lentisphaeria bacterium]|nr:hypothetical protein [Lentisphaeria bacterium]
MTIIVILFMLILPAFNSVKESAKRSECLSRARNIAQLGTVYAANNNGQAPLSAWYVPIGEKLPQADDFSRRIMTSLIPEARGRRDPHWWMFICTNVLPYWNANATMNFPGYDKGQPNPELDVVWPKIKPGNQGKYGDVGYLIGEKLEAVYSFGNFGCNTNGGNSGIPGRKYPLGPTETRKVSLLHMSQIKSPAKRAFIVEEGESTNQDNATHTVQYVKYSYPISRGHDWAGDATGYIPGMGAGGIGKEKMEKIGFDSTVLEELDSERLELVKKDVMEGRHDGATLHGFWDGHAEVIAAETVGSLQLGPSDDLDDLIGPYGNITRAADDDE